MSLLDRLQARGPLGRRSGVFRCMGIEVLGDTLHISGTGPGNTLDVTEDVAIPRKGAYLDEYVYELDRDAAEALLSALQKDFRRDRLPELVLLEEFEFTRPGQTLHSYLEERRIPHRYTLAKMYDF